MNNINIGIANLVISTKIIESSLNENTEIISEIFNILNSSELLKLEFNVFDNIENKYISEDIKAMRYVDNNIKLFETYTIQELDTEHNKLKKYIKKEDIKKADKDRLKLFESIGSLIYESLKINTEVDVNAIHESLDYVVNYIKKDKTKNVTVINEEYSDEIIEIAIDKFNEKYSALDESESIFMKRVIECKNYEDLFTELITENVSLLNNINDDNVESKITLTIKKINEMKYNENTFHDDILKLYELKMGII